MAPCPSPPSPRPAPLREPLTFREARDRLLELGDDYHGARAAFSWPRPHEFNWALEWFDAELAAGEHGRQDRAESHRRARRDAHLRRACPRIVASRQRPALARRQARRSSPDDAGRRPRTVGDDARGDEARPRADPGDADARAKPTSPTGSSAAKRNIWSRMAPTRRNSPALPRASSASRSARPRPAGAPTTRFSAATRFAPDGPTKADDPMLLYFTSGTTARSKLVVHTPRELSDRASLDDVRARPQARRRASQHFLARLGQARLVERVRALERRRDHRSRSPALRAARRARRAGRASGHGVLRAADRVADADPA